MSDARCCGTGSCVINDAGECWCGQVWNGQEMAPPHFINESGLKISSVTGEILHTSTNCTMKQFRE